MLSGQSISTRISPIAQYAGGTSLSAFKEFFQPAASSHIATLPPNHCLRTALSNKRVVFTPCLRGFRRRSLLRQCYLSRTTEERLHGKECMVVCVKTSVVLVTHGACIDFGAHGKHRPLVCWSFIRVLFVAAFQTLSHLYIYRSIPTVISLSAISFLSERKKEILLLQRVWIVQRLPATQTRRTRRQGDDKG